MISFRFIFLRTEARKFFSMSFVVFENNGKLPFYESISLKFSNNLDTYISLKQLKDGNVCISPIDSNGDIESIPLRRPSSCPFAILEQNKVINLPPSRHQWVSVACVVVLESKDGLILLTQRPNHMRTFPNVWVSPGGHVESEENLKDAALRELSEETGLFLTHEDVDLKILCAWESTYPTTLDLGMPKSHHLVLYFKAILKTEEFNIERLAVDPVEVSAYCWLNKAQVAAIVKSFSDPIDMSLIGDYKTSAEDEQFECIEVKGSSNTQLEYRKVIRPLSVLSACIPDISQLHLFQERVSTGTKFALYELLRSYNK